MLAILFSLMIFANAYMVKSIVKTWLFPACIFALFWFAFTFFPLIFLATVPIDPVAILFILLCTIMFSISSVFFNWQEAFNVNKSKLSSSEACYNTRFLMTVFISSQLIVLVTIAINVSLQGFSLYDFVFNYFHSANTYLAMRYNGQIIETIYFKLGTVLNYLGVMIGGLLLPNYKKIKSIAVIIVIALLPSILFMLVYADKGTLFLVLVFFYSGILINRITRNDFSLTNKKTNSVFLVCIIILIPALIISFMARGIYMLQSEALLHKLVWYFSSYAFGHIYAFADWFSHYLFNHSLYVYHDISAPIGYYTFMSVFKWFGKSVSLPPGIYSEYFSYHQLFTTNIYTIFRGLIMDVGILGSLIFMCIMGFVFHSSFYLMLRMKRPVISVAVFILMMGFFYTSFIISLMIWNSIYMAFILLCICLFLNKIRTQSL
tara:strand:- start:211273 stop:212571 length:1299 start_codon:yes stop_codon:yes gene_type:complete